MRINAVIGSLTLAFTATLLAACGSDGSGSSSSGSYCDELKADKTYFESLSGSNADLSNLDTVFAKVHTLAGDAPDSVSDDWKTLDDLEVPPRGKLVLSWAWHPKPLPLAVPAAVAHMAALRGMELTVLRPEGFALPAPVMARAQAAAGAVLAIDRQPVRATMRVLGGA